MSEILTKELDEILGIQDEQATETKTDSETEALVTTSKDTSIVEAEPSENSQRLEDDFEFARTKIRDLVEKGKDALESAIILAQAGDSPRAYEVVGKMLENIVQANKELVGLHKTHRDASVPLDSSPSSSEGGNNVVIDKAVFVGRASDLLREIKSLKKGKTEE